MWVWLDSTGKVIQYLMHGAEPTVGETDFQIFAYIDGLDVDFFDSATIKFRKPDRQGSEYPILFMKKASIKYDKIAADGNSTMFEDGQYYTGFLFDFADFVEGDELVRLLDTPGLWEATITALGSPNLTSVSGLMTFSVGSSASDGEDETDLSIDQLLQNLVLSENILKRSSTYYLKPCDAFTAKAASGLLDINTFTLGSIVFDEATDDFYKITSVTLNESDRTKVYAEYENIFDYVRFAEADSSTQLRDVAAMNDGNAVFLTYNGRDYIAHVTMTASPMCRFDIVDLYRGVRFHGGNASSFITFASALSNQYYVFGAYYTPSVSEDGDLSWSNDYGLPNPATVNIKGPQGDIGPQGEQGPTGLVINSGGNIFAFSVEGGELMVTYPEGSTDPSEYLSIEDGELMYTY